MQPQNLMKIKTNYLFLFTISPVQSFIAQARKTQDLYAASQLLSDLIHYSMCFTEVCAGKSNVEFIFPYETNIDGSDNKLNKSYPNRFLAFIKNNDKSKVKQIGNCVEHLLKNKFADIARAIFERYVYQQTQPNAFKEQISKFLEVYWVAIPCEENEYLVKYQQIESYLGQVKSLRKFEQLSELGRKCSLSGEMNVLFAKYHTKKKLSINAEFAGTDKIWVDEYNNSLCEVKKDYRHYIKSTEGLSAIGLVKRFYLFNETDEFPSTAKIALLNILADTKLKTLIKEYKQIFENLDYKFDEQLLLEENLSDKHLSDLQKEDNGNEIDNEIRKKIRNKQKEFFDSIEQNKIPFTKYYALLSFDGDKMGELLDGVSNKQEHKDISVALACFAVYAKDYLNSPQRGRTIYAGGDDFLGFVNLLSLFEVLHHLRREFHKRVAVRTNKLEFTFSAGIVIAHYKTPLQEVIKQAKIMEKTAKEKGKRDAFAIRVMKHAGEINQTYCKWNLNIDNDESSIKKAKEIYELLSVEGGTKVVKMLEREFGLLMHYENKKERNGEIRYCGHADWIDSEITRLTERASIPKLAEKLIDLHGDFQSYGYAGLYQFLSLLNVLLFLKREIK